MSDKKILKKDEVLLHEGEQSSNMYWVSSGKLVVTRQRGAGAVTLGHIGPGELVGEMSFLDGEPRSATVTAVTDCELVEVPRLVFEDVIRKQPVWFQGLLRILTDRLRKINQRIRV
jgi:CRP/FNR family cyclic AMP-dependent transcriptional regulator